MFSAFIVGVIDALFFRNASVQLSSAILLGVFACYIPLFVFILSNLRAAPPCIARLFLYGGFGLLILGFIVWAEFNGYQSSTIVSEPQKRALTYYTQFASLFSSFLGGSAIFHGIRLFSEIANP